MITTKALHRLGKNKYVVVSLGIIFVISCYNFGMIMSHITRNKYHIDYITGQVVRNNEEYDRIFNVRVLSNYHNGTLHPYKNKSVHRHHHLSHSDGINIASGDRFDQDSNRDLQPCSLISPNLRGEIAIDTTNILSFEEISEKYKNLELGGHYKPPNCNSKHKVAIIVPYRNREKHLRLFLDHMHGFLQRQEIEYGIFVVELAPRVEFNRGILLNIGFMETSRHYGYTCFIFHDVDLLPENDLNFYVCSHQTPKHLSIAVDKFNYSLPYSDIFGGVTALTTNQFQLLNGYSNKYFGWGGEDDDMSKRLETNHMVFSRLTPDVARYKMLSHSQEKKNRKRKAILRSNIHRWKEDGLNTLEYDVLLIENTRLYTYILADIDVTNSKYLIQYNDRLFYEAFMEQKLIDIRRKGLGVPDEDLQTLDP